MGLRPTASVRQPHSPEAPPSPLSSRPELRRSVVERSAVSTVLAWKCFPLCRRLISGGQHSLEEGRLSFFMDHGCVHIFESRLAQQQLQFHLTEA
jgi:hypothetical protein